MPAICAMFPDIFINIGTGGQVKTDLDIYKKIIQKNHIGYIIYFYQYYMAYFMVFGCM